MKKFTVKNNNLEKLFRDASTIFRRRVKDLANLDISTSQIEYDAMRLMLETLIASKERLHNSDPKFR